MEKVTIDYNRLCLELEKQGKTKADLSRDMTKNKNFVGLMEKNPDQPAEVERLMCLLLGLEQGSLIKQEEATGSQGEIKILENLHKEMREIHQAIIEYGELIEKIWSKVHANTLQLEKVNRAQGQQIRRETAWEYLQRRCGLRGDAGGDNKGAAPGIPE